MMTARALPTPLALLPLLLLTAGCGGALVPAPTSADAAWLEAQGTPTTLADLARGRRLYVARCSGCHALVPPSPPPTEGWPRALARMAPRARLDERGRALVLAYLRAASRAERRAAPP